MKYPLLILAACGLTSCEAMRGYTPMLSLGFEIGGSKITVGVAPLPTLQKTATEPVELPTIVIPDSK